jgi:hypothetical protein
MDMHPQIDNGIPVITGINASDARRPVKEFSEYKKGQKIYVRPGQEGARYVGQILVVTRNTEDRVYFLNETGKEMSLHKKFVESAEEREQELSLVNEMIQQFHIKPGDIFATPAEAHKVMTEVVGWDTATAFDPCGLPAEEMRNADGTLRDGLTIDWQDLYYCNPPFSQTERWLQKAARETNAGRSGVVLISAEFYFTPRKNVVFEDMARLCNVRMIRWNHNSNMTRKLEKNIKKKKLVLNILCMPLPRPTYPDNIGLNCYTIQVLPVLL